MKIILMQDVYKQGVAGDVVSVAPGFARNYLIPRGMALKATPGSLKQAENLRKRADVRRAEKNKEYTQIAERIKGLEMFFSVRAGETGKLYGSVTSAEIAAQLKEMVGLEVDRRRIGDQPLRELGEFSVPVRLEAGLIPHVRVVVFREGEDPRVGDAVVEEAVEAAPAAQVEMIDEVPAEPAESMEEVSAEQAESVEETPSDQV
jgi:large subunit ribosomal protein L9